MNREYLHVNSSRWKTQVALLWGRGSSPPTPSAPSPHSSILQSMAGDGLDKAPRCCFFQVSKIPNDPNTHPVLLLHSCGCKIAAWNRSVVKLPSPGKQKIRNKRQTRSVLSDHEIHELSPRPPPPSAHTPGRGQRRPAALLALLHYCWL